MASSGGLKIESLGDVFSSICEVLLILDPDEKIRYSYGSKTNFFSGYREGIAGFEVTELLDTKSKQDFGKAIDKIKIGSFGNTNIPFL